MKMTATIARYLLGLVFVVFGLNGFLHFIPQPPPEGVAAQFLGALAATGYMVPVFLLQLIGGLLLLIGRFVPLSLVLLAPVIVNILLFHVTMAPSGLPVAILVTVLWLLVYLGYRPAFAGILASRLTNV